MEKEPTPLDIAYAMIHYGGSFFQHLGQALLHADSQNQERIKATWPDEWEKYRDFASTEK